MTPDYTDLIASLRWHMQQTELIANVLTRAIVRTSLRVALECAENAQQAIVEQSGHDDPVEMYPDPYMDALHARLDENYKRQRESGCRICMENAKSLRGPCDEHPWPTEQSARDAAPNASEGTITD